MQRLRGGVHWGNRQFSTKKCHSPQSADKGPPYKNVACQRTYRRMCKPLKSEISYISVLQNVLRKYIFT